MNGTKLVIAIFLLSCLVWGDENEQLIDATPYSASGYGGIKLQHVEEGSSGVVAGNHRTEFGVGTSFGKGWLISFGPYADTGDYIGANFTMGYFKTDHLMKKFTARALLENPNSWDTSYIGPNFLANSTFHQVAFTLVMQLNFFPVLHDAGVKSLPIHINPFVGFGLSNNILFGTAGRYEIDSTNPFSTADTIMNSTVAAMELGYTIPAGVTFFPFQQINNQLLSKIGFTIGYAYHGMWVLPFWAPDIDRTVPENVGFGTRDSRHDIFLRMEIAY